jgi:hypothetical protein
MGLTANHAFESGRVMCGILVASMTIDLLELVASLD